VANPDPLFDQLSASTLQDMRRGHVQDNFFVETSLQRIMRYYSSQDPFSGGLWMQEPFIYDRVNGGAYPPGQDVQVEQKQILAATLFQPKAYKEDVPINLWQTEVINHGPAAAVSIYDMYMESAVSAMSTDVNIDLYQHGQAASTGVAVGRSIYTNGFDEAVNDGVNPTWLGNYYTTYGGQLRNGNVGNTLNAIPVWGGNSDGTTGQANWGTVVDAYLNCVQPPDTAFSNKALWGYLWKREEPKQRFHIEKDARIGLEGFHVFDMMYHVDKLCPSTKFGTILPSGLSQTTSIKPATFTMPSLTTAQVAVSGYPASFTGTINPGEPMFLMRMQDWKPRVSTSAEYNHNFTPPIRSQSNPDLIVMFYKLGLTWYSPSPRDNSQIVGFGY
jgi:hypothetical protein